MTTQNGYEFSSSNAQSVEPEVKKQSGFFGELAKSIIALFAPAKDDYPNTGFQPFTGELNRDRHEA
ncbi:MAG: hypothetical protein AAGH78_04105 [Cyanobacteria bacterium P01_H01_bin.58]